MNKEQDGRLAPGYFSQEYKYFDQHICPPLKTRLLFKIWFAKVFYKHQFHHWFLYSMQKRGVSRLFVQNFLSHSTEKFRWGTLRWIRKFRVAKNFKHKKGISLNSVEKSLSHSADKIRRRTLLFRKNSGIAKEGGSFTVLSKFFLSDRTEKTSPGNHSVFQKISGREKYFMDKRGGGYHDFPSKFLSHCTEIFHWRTLWCFRKLLLSKIFMHKRGGILVLSNFFVSQDRNGKLCKGTLLFSESFLVSKKIYE